MKYCLPDEIFNRIDFPPGGEVVNTTLDGIYREVAYKLPGANETAVRKEIWHALVDFCVRTGALLERLNGQGAQRGVVTIPITPQNFGTFMRIVGAELQWDENGEWEPTNDFRVASDGTLLYCTFEKENLYNARITISVRPRFDDESTDTVGGESKWSPKVPQYFIERYGECITHGALMRIYAQRGEGGMARMHATAYNNDLNRLSFGLITSGMRKHLLIDVEDYLVNTREAPAQGQQG